MLSQDALTTVETVNLILGLDLVLPEETEEIDEPEEGNEPEEGLTEEEQDQIARVEFLINAASAYANQRAGRKLKGRDLTLQLDGKGRNVLILPSAPVDIESVSVDNNRVFDNALGVTEYLVNESEGMIRLINGNFPAGIANVQVKGTFGFDPVPEDLEQAVIECVASNLRRLGSTSAVGLRTVSTGGNITSTYELDWPLTAIAVFDSYRRMNI